MFLFFREWYFETVPIYPSQTQENPVKNKELIWPLIAKMEQHLSSKNLKKTLVFKTMPHFVIPK